jgi:hypothetical protein
MFRYSKTVQQLFAHFKRIFIEEIKYDILKITIRILSRIFSDKKQRDEEQYTFTKEMHMN